MPAALQHARLGARTLAFAPRVDLSLSHGSFVPASAQKACLEAIAVSTTTCPRGSIMVHVGMGNHVDMAQVGAVRHGRSVLVVEHETFHHNVPAHLEGQGELVGILKAEVLNLLRANLLSAAGAEMDPV